MNFASKRSFLPSNEEELDEYFAQAQPISAAFSNESPSIQADTNVVIVKFGDLGVDSGHIFAGDAVFCAGCRVVLSRTSKDHIVFGADAAAASASASGSGSAVWTCEFCSHRNVVDVSQEEIPDQEMRDYVLSAASVSDDHKDKNGGSVIFCMDVSGSMCVTKEVIGSIQLKGTRSPSGFGSPQPGDAPLPRAGRSTWISRLQCMQAAVAEQISTWTKDCPGRRVGLVTFNNDVTVIGDGSSPPEVVAGAKLHDHAQLQEIGSRLALSRGVGEAGQTLSATLFAIEETGATALGPGLLVSIAMAAKEPGTRVVVCTDGLANVGLGSLDIKDPTQLATSRQWYEGVANFAKASGVTVSVISLKGDECSLEDLGTVAEITGGSVELVDPLDLTRNFSSFLAKPVVASNVSCTFLLHRGLKFRSVLEELTPNKAVRELGNVTEDTEIAFEYSMRSREAVAELAHLKALPFQVQMCFTKLDGMRCLRVLSKAQPVTNSRAASEEGVSMEILAANSAQQCARLAEIGDYAGARANVRAWEQLMNRSSRDSHQEAVVHQYSNVMSGFDKSVQQQQAASDNDMLLSAGLKSSSRSTDHAQSMKSRARMYRKDAQFAELSAFKHASPMKFSPAAALAASNVADTPAPAMKPPTVPAAPMKPHQGPKP